jgi:hypothetical protein
MPASDFVGWQEYFSIYPFTQDREDLRSARLCAVITNMSGKAVERTVDARDFLPDYLMTRQPAPQGDGWEGFKAKLRALKRGK